MLAVRCTSQVHPAHRLAGRGDARENLHKDDRIRWFITSANRDPEVFTQVDTFDISRDPNPHVAFGSGASLSRATLARLEGQEVFKALAERFPSLHLETEHLSISPASRFAR